jgi:hypothetical protein
MILICHYNTLVLFLVCRNLKRSCKWITKFMHFPYETEAFSHSNIGKTKRFHGLFDLKDLH